MTKVQMRTGIKVELINSMASDDAVIQAAQVSVKGKNSAEVSEAKKIGMIHYLMKSRHGSPFEHNAFTFYVEAPIFVFREWHRHRIASINEMSGRYAKLLPKFYTPAFGRGLINLGSSAHPVFLGGKTSRGLEQFKRNGDTLAAQNAWDLYEDQLNAGIAKEVARTVLPVNIYSQMYWTVNARSLMNFLSLRVQYEKASYPSKPQWEIQMGAWGIERIFAEQMPITYEAFIKNGMVAP